MTPPPTPTSLAHQIGDRLGLAQRDGRTLPRRAGTATPVLPARPDQGAAGPAIETRGLTKRCGARTVVDRLDINVPSGWSPRSLRSSEGDPGAGGDDHGGNDAGWGR
jgi:hypothetical protein